MIRTRQETDCADCYEPVTIILLCLIGASFYVDVSKKMILEYNAGKKKGSKSEDKS
jgi:hypothetical protein